MLVWRIYDVASAHLTAEGRGMWPFPSFVVTAIGKPKLWLCTSSCEPHIVSPWQTGFDVSVDEMLATLIVAERLRLSPLPRREIRKLPEEFPRFFAGFL